MQSAMIDVNALNKSTQEKIIDLRETSLLATTIEAQLRQCHIMSNN